MFAGLYRFLSSGGRISSFIRFVGVGGAATLIHGVALHLLVVLSGLHPTLANFAAFLVAFAVSYLGHYYISFQSSSDHTIAAAKFLVTALIGLMLNTLIFLITVNYLSLHYFIAFAVVIVAVPPVIFSIARAFVFKSDADPVQQKAEAEKIYSIAQTYGAPAVLCVITLFYIILFHFQAPYFDGWDLITLQQRLEGGEFGLDDLFYMHGAHWHASAYVILLGLSMLTGMDHLYEGLTSLCFAAIGFIGLALIVRRAAAVFAIESALPVLMVLAALFWFSLDQSLNWLWGWQVAVYINIAGAVWMIALFASDRVTWLRFLFAVIAFGVSITAFATALVLLPIGGLLLLQQLLRDAATSRNQKLIQLCVWGMVSIAVVALFLRYNNAPDAIDSSAQLRTGVAWVTSYVHYLINYFASPITRFATGLALPVVAASVYFAYWLSRRSGITFVEVLKEPAYAALFALMLYGAGAGILTGLGRVAEFGAVQGFSSRYITFGNFFWIGLILMTAGVVAKLGYKENRFSPPVIVLSLLLALKIGNSISGGNKYIQQAPMRDQAIAVIVAARPEIDREALLVFSNPHQQLNDDLEFLETRRLSFFHREKE